MTTASSYYLDIIRGRAVGPLAAAARAALWLAAQGYGVAVAARNRRYDRGRGVARAGVPVVSVGNLTAGGTGKTPCVEYAARFCRDELGLAAAILSRGYGGGGGPNDEALVLEENLPDVPHLQGRDRAALARTAVEELEADVLVLDDGFQHRRLARDLDVVLLDATDPFGGGHVHPRGLLREPAWGLRRAGVVVLTRCDLVPAAAVDDLHRHARRLAPRAAIARTVHTPTELVNADRETYPVEGLRGRPVLGVCGIGNPDAFRATLGRLGADVRDFAAFPDHHAYTRGDVDALARRAAGLPAEGWVATTQKDLVKLRVPELAGRAAWAVRVGLEFLAGREAFHARLADAATRDGRTPR